jgi:hypothetical protein
MPQVWPSPSNRLSRAALSLVCAVLASVIVCAIVIAYNYEEFSRSLTSWFLFIRDSFLIIMLAWVVTLPFVLLISRFNGWRFWLLAVSGTVMGPALLIVLSFCIHLALRSPTFDILDGWKTELLVTAISLIATTLYLGTLRFSTRDDALSSKGCAANSTHHVGSGRVTGHPEMTG